MHIGEGYRPLNNVEEKFGDYEVNGARQANGEGYFTLLAASHYIIYVELHISYVQE